MERPVGRVEFEVVELPRRGTGRVLLLGPVRRVLGMADAVPGLVDLDTARTSVGSALIFTSVFGVLEASGALGVVEVFDGLRAFLMER